MVSSEFVNHYVMLSFDEANILKQNFKRPDQVCFIARIDNLMRHNKDPHLQKELSSLLSKIQNLTPAEFRQLARDIESNVDISPPNYILPHFE